MKSIRVTLAISSVAVASAFVTSPSTIVGSKSHYEQQQRGLNMVGFNGKGWDNDSFLDSLGGNEEDREKSLQEYKEYQTANEAFIKRQQERMNSEQGKAFMKAREEAMRRQQEQLGEDVDGVDLFMQAAAGGQGRKLGGSNLNMGFEQKFVVPLDDDDDSEQNTNDAEEEPFA